MMDATVRQLQIFAAVARHLSLTRAAEELRLTQPAVSMQVKALEELAGLPLLERVGRRVLLTEAGLELVRHAGAVLRSLADAEDSFAALRGLRSGRLPIAVVTTAKYFAPRLIALFARQHRGIELRLAVANREAVLKEVADGGVDLAIVGTPPRRLEATSFPFARHPLVVIAPPDHPLATGRPVAAAALSRETFLVREPGSGTRAAQERYFAAHSIVPAAVMEVESNETIKEAVAAGLGLGFISQHAVGLELQVGHLALVHAGGLPIVRSWHLVHRSEKRLAPVSQAFKRFILKEGRAYLASWTGTVAPRPSRPRRP